MDVTYADKDLEEIEVSEQPRTRYDRALIRAFKKTMNFVRQAEDERDLYQGGLRCEKLKGDRAHQHSLRLNDQWRLVFKIEKGETANTFCVISIEDYH